MQNSVIEYFTWDFPGGIAGVAALLVVLLAVVVLSYRWTLSGLGRGKQVLLVLLRYSWYVLLVLCLCNPRKVREETFKEQSRQKIAVVMDASTSMRKKCFTGKSRLEECREFFKRCVKPACDDYDISYWYFADHIQQVSSLENIPDATENVLNTRLYSSASEWTDAITAQGADAVVCFSDGVDTADEKISPALKSINASALRQAFVLSSSPQSGAPYLKLSRVESPTTANVGTKISVNLLASFSGLQAGKELKLSVLEQGRKIAGKVYSTSPCASGSWSENFSITLDTPGTHTFTAALENSGEPVSSCTWSVEAHKRRRTRMLLYQGGLDWGTRFLRGASGTAENDFSIDVKFAPDALGSHSRLGSLQSQFPTEQELKNYDVVVIMKMKRQQLTSLIEKRLQKFVENGGSLLFIIANSIHAQEYAASGIEKFLPVVFEKNSQRNDRLTKAFMTQMARYRAPRKIPLLGNRVDPNRDYSIKVPPLTTMSLTAEGKRSPLFKYLGPTKGYCLPAFQDFALITHSKPGAAVLAVHPRFLSGNRPRILLAEQRYGLGRSAVLATDPLWRWRLSLPSGDQSYYMFWKHLMNWLSCANKSKPYFTVPSCLVDCGSSLRVRFDIPYSSRTRMHTLSMSVVSPGETSRQSLVFESLDGKGYSASFTPDRPGVYTFEARNAEGVVATACLTAQDSRTSKELLLTKPDVKSMKRLGSCRNSIFVPDPQDFSWQEWLPQKQTVEKTVSMEYLLWHDWRLFVLVLFLLMAELIARRCFKLV